MLARIDLQTHTDHSPQCGWMSVKRLIDRAIRQQLDGLAITDHNTMAGCKRAAAYAPDDFLIIPGQEIDTTDGQIIGLFLSSPIEPSQSVRKTISNIKNQGGIALAPHPFDRFRSGLDSLEEHAKDIDAIEVINSRNLLQRDNRRAAVFAQQHNLIKVAGSDAHFGLEIGNAYTLIYLDSDRLDQWSVRKAILSGRTYPIGSRGLWLVHAGTKILKLWRRISQAPRK